MLLVILMVLITGTLSAEINPTLTEWTLIDKPDMKVPFLINDYILQIKSFMPADYDTNPKYGDKMYVDKSTSMITELFEDGEYAGRLTWNTIKYEIGFDVLIFECDHEYQVYNSWPCGKEHEQIWAWNLDDKKATLTCNDEVQYKQKWHKGDKAVEPSRTAFPDRYESCLALGARTGINTLRFLNMENFYYRGVPRPPIDPAATTSPTTAISTTVTSTPATSTTRFSSGPPTYPTCDCWTADCGYCSDLACAVNYDVWKSNEVSILPPSVLTIVVTSEVNKKNYNTIVLFDESGKDIGRFKWNQRRMFLIGCIACRTPHKVARLPSGVMRWVFELRDDAVVLKIGDLAEVVVERKLSRGCHKVYGKAVYFAFEQSSCEGTYEKSIEMTRGEKMDKTCGGACPELE